MGRGVQHVGEKLRVNTKRGFLRKRFCRLRRANRTVGWMRLYISIFSIISNINTSVNRREAHETWNLEYLKPTQRWREPVAQGERCSAFEYQAHRNAFSALPFHHRHSDPHSTTISQQQQVHRSTYTSHQRGQLSSHLSSSIRISLKTPIFTMLNVSFLLSPLLLVHQLLYIYGYSFTKWKSCQKKESISNYIRQLIKYSLWSCTDKMTCPLLIATNIQARAVRWGYFLSDFDYASFQPQIY